MPKASRDRSLGTLGNKNIAAFKIMVEVQFHGFTFEKWVRDTFFDGYEGNYMQKWDIPPDKNSQLCIPSEHRNIPVSVKTAKYGSPIGLGDVRRQRSIDTPFMIIVGFWKQRTPSEKWFEEIGVALFTVPVWSGLWGALTIEEISEIDSRIKDLTLPYATARQTAQAWKSNRVSQSGGEIQSRLNSGTDIISEILLWAMSTYSTFDSMPNHLRPNVCAEAAVVPLPRNGSSTQSPFFVLADIS